MFGHKWGVGALAALSILSAYPAPSIAKVKERSWHRVKEGGAYVRPATTSFATGRLAAGDVFYVVDIKKGNAWGYAAGKDFRGCTFTLEKRLGTRKSKGPQDVKSSMIRKCGRKAPSGRSPSYDDFAIAPKTKPKPKHKSCPPTDPHKKQKKSYTCPFVTIRPTALYANYYGFLANQKEQAPGGPPGNCYTRSACPTGYTKVNGCCLISATAKLGFRYVAAPPNAADPKYAMVFVNRKVPGTSNQHWWYVAAHDIRPVCSQEDVWLSNFDWLAKCELGQCCAASAAALSTAAMPRAVGDPCDAEGECDEDEVCDEATNTCQDCLGETCDEPGCSGRQDPDCQKCAAPCDPACAAFDEVTDAIPASPATSTDPFLSGSVDVDYFGGPLVIGGGSDGTQMWSVSDSISLTVHRPDGTSQTWSHDFSAGCTAPGTPTAPADLSSLVQLGLNAISFDLVNACGGDIGASAITIAQTAGCGSVCGDGIINPSAEDCEERGELYDDGSYCNRKCTCDVADDSAEESICEGGNPSSGTKVCYAQRDDCAGYPMIVRPSPGSFFTIGCTADSDCNGSGWECDFGWTCAEFASMFPSCEVNQLSGCSTYPSFQGMPACCCPVAHAEYCAPSTP